MYVSLIAIASAHVLFIVLESLLDLKAQESTLQSSFLQSIPSTMCGVQVQILHCLAFVVRTIDSLHGSSDIAVGHFRVRSSHDACCVVAFGGCCLCTLRAVCESAI